jgi:hypothetical protein
VVTFFHSARDMSPFLLSGRDVAFATFPGILAVLVASASVVIGEMTANTSHNFKVRGPEALAKRTICQLVVRTAVGVIRAKIAQQNYLIGNY